MIFQIQNEPLRFLQRLILYCILSNFMLLYEKMSNNESALHVVSAPVSELGMH